MKPQLVDLHCHLDLYPDPVAAINDAETAGVYTLAVTTTPQAWYRNLVLTRDTRYVRAALGLHPELIAERGHEISVWESFLSETRYIGEVGLDASPRHYHSFDVQKKIFDRILKSCAKARGKILTVHSVRAAKAVLDLIEANLQPPLGHTVLHWFSGSAAEARRAVDLGCYFSINAEMLRSERGRSLVRTLPSDRLLTETDGPFTEVDGRPARPVDIGKTVEGMANLLETTSVELATTVSTNLKNLLRSAGVATESVS